MQCRQENAINTEMFFDGWSSIIRTLVLGTGAYLSLVLLLRVSGKRTLSKMNAFDFVVTVALGSTLASILTSKNVALAQGITAFALLIILQFAITFLAVRWKWVRNLIKAQPTLLFFKGEFIDEAMRRKRVTKDEVLSIMRGEGVTDPHAVLAVVMETEGSLSVIQGEKIDEAAIRDLGVPTA